MHVSTKKTVISLLIVTLVSAGAFSYWSYWAAEPKELTDGFIRQHAVAWIEQAYFGTAQPVNLEIKQRQEDGEGRYKIYIVATLEFSKTSTELGRELAKSYLEAGGKMEDFEDFYFDENSRFSGMVVGREEKRALPLVFQKDTNGSWGATPPIMLPELASK